MYNMETLVTNKLMCYCCFNKSAAIQWLAMKHMNSVTGQVRSMGWDSVGYKQAVGTNAFFLRLQERLFPYHL